MTGHHAAPGSETAAHHTSTETAPEAGAHAPGTKPIAAADTEPAPAVQPVPSKSRSVLFLPLTFPLTVGGTTFAFGVAASASAPGIKEKVLVSVAAVCYALVTGITLYAAGHVTRRISAQAMVLLDRIAGILLTAIAVILLVNGFTAMVLSRIH